MARLACLAAAARRAVARLFRQTLGFLSAGCRADPPSSGHGPRLQGTAHSTTNADFVGGMDRVFRRARIFLLSRWRSKDIRGFEPLEDRRIVHIERTTIA
jgi:hypothetical protein